MSHSDSTPTTSPQPVTPVHVPTQRIVLAGTAVWALALLVTLLVPAFHTGDRAWWPWCAVAGVALGLLGWSLVRRGRGNFHEA
ncbi:MAG TPA: DUF2530 domain-containing protein [Dermatophilaceae bacterium]|nr:DUF2530 domain-containing protein [Actinomycetales bacterium]HMT32362.1 DUF2530 domain-containing protein [Dermatophilaceae bacterium]HMT88825.1 DUF2530 domain-containing protein [Dermatophilaceae bacterium]